jgi:hypothetical protein
LSRDKEYPGRLVVEGIAAVGDDVAGAALHEQRRLIIIGRVDPEN